MRYLMNLYLRCVPVVTTPVLIVVIAAGCGSQDIDDRMIGQIQALKESIVSGVGSFSYRYELINNKGTLAHGQVTDTVENGTFRFKGEKFVNTWNFESKPGYTLRVTTAYNGSIRKQLSENIHENRDNTLQGHITYHKPNPSPETNPLFYAVDYLNMAIRQEKEGRWSITKVSKGIYDGKHCRIIEFRGKTRIDKFWVSEKLSYRVLRITRSINGKLSGDTHIWYRQVDGIPFPKRITDTLYGDNSTDVVCVKITTFGDDWKLNEDMPDSTFELQFPEGISIIDQRQTMNENGLHD